MFKFKIFVVFILCIVAAAAYYVVGGFKPHSPKIYDCFLFYNELELLEIRFKEMYDHVDYFVIAEGAETFRGNAKPFYLEENLHLFDQYADKIIHVKIEEKLQTNDPWTRERYQRQQVLRGLKECHRNDIVILSDLDEIVSGSRIPKIASLLNSKEAEVVVCEQDMYLGFMNRYQAKWRGSVCTTAKVLKRLTTKKVRRLRNMKRRLIKRCGLSNVVCIRDAGWHFTSMGGIDRFILKMESYSHQEHDTAELKGAARILQIFRSHPLVTIDETFPKCVQENQKYYQEIGFLDVPVVDSSLPEPIQR